MKFIQINAVVADNPGASIFREICKEWNSIKDIDKTYEGPISFWEFYQAGDFDNVDMTIFKFNLFSNFHYKLPYNEPNLSNYVGANALVVFYNPGADYSFDSLKESLNHYLEKRRNTGENSPFICYAISSSPNPETEIRDVERDYIKANGGHLITLNTEILKKNPKQVFYALFMTLIMLLQQKIAVDTNVKNNWWHLTLDDLKKILMADKMGKKLQPRHKVNGRIAIVGEKAKPKPMPLKEAIEEKPEFKERKLTMDDLSEEERRFVAIGPNGEIVPIKADINQEEVMKLVKEGYKLPSWVYIPRHCPECFNQNQKMIREVEDKTIILMMNPPIYGMKLLCGYCGHEWHHQNIEIKD